MKWLRKEKTEKKEKTTEKTNDLRLSIKDYIFPPVHAQGIVAALIALFITLIVIGWSRGLNLLGVLFLMITAAVYYFFRDPNRIVPQEKGLIVAPADGIVSNIVTKMPPKEMQLGSEPLTRISIFMSVFNVHINRTPIEGTVTHINYVPGKFLNVADKDNEDNERKQYTLETAEGVKVGFIQIAGLIARRIYTYPSVKEGATLKTGERFGLIRFGSRLDVYLPKGVVPQVFIGQTMVAGETVLARLGTQPTQYNGESI